MNKLIAGFASAEYCTTFLCVSVRQAIIICICIIMIFIYNCYLFSFLNCVAVDDDRGIIIVGLHYRPWPLLTPLLRDMLKRQTQNLRPLKVSPRSLQQDISPASLHHMNTNS